MINANLVDQLDAAIDEMLARPDSTTVAQEPLIREMVEAAGRLRLVARPDFKARLKANLQEQASALTRPPVPSLVGQAAPSPLDHNEHSILPSLFGQGYNAFPVQRANFVASFLLHTAAMALLLTSGAWMVQHREEVKQQFVSVLVGPSPYVLPSAPDQSGGGGGGGDRDKIAASKGAPPRFSNQQLTPPAVIIRNYDPRLAVQPTVIGPPSLSFPQTGQTGDPLSAVLAPPSNGTGSGGGIGSGVGGGVGSGHGAGLGPGSGGGFGGGTYRVGGGVSAPRAIYSPDPEYSDEARSAKYQGTVVLWVVVGPDGRAREMKVARSLGMGLDQKALEAVRNWRFEPARKDGRPVAVQINVEINFHLY